MSFDFETELATERVRRVRELSNARLLFIDASNSLKVAASHGLIVLCYAHWEGYYNFCTRVYVRYINSLGVRTLDINPALLACEIDPFLDSLRSKDFKVQHRPKFARDVYSKVETRKLL